MPTQKPQKPQKPKAPAKPKPTKPKKPTGRPPIYGEETRRTILARIADGESLRQICATEGMPNREEVRKWLIRDEVFAGQYARAREEQADSLVEEMLDAARREAVDATDVQNRRLLVDTLKWRAGKLKPKVYGDKAQIDVDTPAGGVLSGLLGTIAGNALPVRPQPADE